MVVLIRESGSLDWALISNLEAGLTLDEFLDNFPTVPREQALQVLEFSKTTILKLRKTA